MSNPKVIGYFAMKPPANCCCDGEALIVAGSHATIKKMLAISGATNVRLYKILKARFGEVLTGIKAGGAYSFDAESYRKFAPLARDEGIPCQEFDFTPATPEEIKLVTISL